MSILEIFLNAFLGIVLIPIFISAHLSAFGYLENYFTQQDKLIDYWKDKLSGKSYIEIFDELHNDYPSKTIKLLAKPDKHLIRRMRKILTSKYFERILAVFFLIIYLQIIGIISSYYQS